MRDIKYIVVHCTAGSQLQTIKDLKAEFKRKGWKAPGYHYVISVNGVITELLPVEKVSNGVMGHNSNSINVAYTGGIDRKFSPIDNRTEAQKTSLRMLLASLKEKFPNAIIQGHRDFPLVAKSCPCFDAKEEYKDM